MPNLYDAFVPASVISVAAQASEVIRPAEGCEVALHHIFNSGLGQLELTDGTSSVVIASGNGSFYYNGSVRLTYGMYAKFTSTELVNAQNMVYNGVYTKVP